MRWPSLIRGLGSEDVWWMQLPGSKIVSQSGHLESRNYTVYFPRTGKRNNRLIAT